MNAKQELIEHVGDREVKYVHITISERTIAGTLPEVLPLLDFDYDNGYGEQKLFGNIWYADGTWSERREYDGSEWWTYKVCPDIPNPAEPVSDCCGAPLMFSREDPCCRECGEHCNAEPNEVDYEIR